MTRWGTPKEYAAYYRLLLTRIGRLEFLGWLERENPALFVKVAKELKLDSAISSGYSTGPGQRMEASAGDEGVPIDEGEVPQMGEDILAGSD